MTTDRSSRIAASPRDGESAKKRTEKRSRNTATGETESRVTNEPSVTVASVSMTTSSNAPGGESREFTDSDIKPDSVFEATLGFHQMELDDELILVDVLRNNYLRLNSTATHIWRLVQQRTPLDDVSGQVSKAFGLPPDRAYEVVSSFARDLIEAGIASPAQQPTHDVEQE